MGLHASFGHATALVLFALLIIGVSGISMTQLGQRSAEPAKLASVSIDAAASVEVGDVSERRQDVVYHLHISKNAGWSFMVDELAILRHHNLKQVSLEGCFSYQDEDPRVLFTSLLLRNPRSHLISMFDFCRVPVTLDYRSLMRPQGAPDPLGSFEDWVREWRQRQDAGWHGDFTPPKSPVTDNRSARFDAYRSDFMSRWERPPWSPEPVTLDPEDWNRLGGGGIFWHHTAVPFQCYVPISFQTQRLSCRKAMEFDPPPRPNLTLALSNLESAWFVGLVEQYQASICLLRLKLGEAPPAYCDCRHPERWMSFRETYLNKNTNMKDRTNFDTLSQDTLSEMDKLVAADLLLYKAGQRRFVREVREMEQKHNITLLCNLASDI